MSKQARVYQYRIHRVDARNLAIQRKAGKRWDTISYHGNSLTSLANGLLALLMSRYEPDSDTELITLLEQVESLKQYIDTTKTEIETLIKAAFDNDV